MRFNEAIKELQYRRGKRFVLTGDEIYLKELFAETAKKMYDPVFSFFPGDEEALKNAFYSDLFEDEKLIIIRHFEEMKKFDFKGLVKKYTGSLIVMISEETNLKIPAITDTLSYCTPVTCNKMSEFGPDYPAWLVSKASERGYLFVDDAEGLLYHKVGPDMLMLFSELEKLMIYKEATKSISPDDVTKIATNSASGSTYEILDNILRKDPVKIFKSLDLYLKNNDDLDGLVYFLSHYFEKLYRMILMFEAKIPPESVGEILNIHPFLIKTKYLPRAQSFGKDLIVQCLDRLGQVEVGLRGFSCKKLLLDRFIFSLIT